MTIFVGPNNSGKSLVLREIERFSTPGHPNTPFQIIDEISVPRLSETEITEALRRFSVPPPPNKPLAEGQLYLHIPQQNSQAIERTEDVARLSREIYSGWNHNNISRYILAPYILRLDGSSRLGIGGSQGTEDLRSRRPNLLMRIFLNYPILTKVRELLLEAFGLYFTIDATSMTSVRIRFSKRPPKDKDEEQSYSRECVSFHDAATPVDELSDGVKAFTGLIINLMSGDYRLILIDEPEAFLHPPLARKLGNLLATLAAEREGHVFASTHSPHFLVGSVQSGKRVTVIRLTYSDGLPTARALPSDELNGMMRDPLLRSTGVLNALFHRCAVVCEGDVDRAFYDEVNERLLAAGQEGISDCTFLATHGKQSLQKVSGPLRKMGIPCAIIVDLDILENRGEFSSILKASSVPQELVNSWGAVRGEVVAGLVKHGVKLNQPIPGTVPPQHFEALDRFLSSLRDYGIFVVPRGPVESWLRHLNVNTNNKQGWLSDIFDKMGTDPADPAYLNPQEGDIWGFLSSVGAWTSDVRRLGIPSGRGLRVPIAAEEAL